MLINPLLCCGGPKPTSKTYKPDWDKFFIAFMCYAHEYGSLPEYAAHCGLDLDNLASPIHQGKYEPKYVFQLHKEKTLSGYTRVTSTTWFLASWSDIPHGQYPALFVPETEHKVVQDGFQRVVEERRYVSGEHGTSYIVTMYDSNCGLG